jgi:hypothetical protein
MNITRKWAMPSADTFDVPAIGEFVKSYLRHSKVSIDPFARNKRWATYTNDLNPETAAEYHCDAGDFLQMLLDRGVQADLIIFDPPYTINQIEEVYAGVGKNKFTFEEYSQLGRWNVEKNICNQLLSVGGVFLHFGYHTNGMGKDRKFEILEILMVAHGGAMELLMTPLEKRKNILYTIFAFVMVKLIAPDRITTEMIRSKEWTERRKKFYELFEDMVIEQENRKETK